MNEHDAIARLELERQVVRNNIGNCRGLAHDSGSRGNPRPPGSGRYAQAVIDEAMPVAEAEPAHGLAGLMRLGWIMIDTPVLVTIFNRPEHTAAVFEAIRSARPKRLFVSPDAPRADRTSDIELCRSARAVIQTDWPCDLQWLIPESNCGCRLGMFEAISWFFGHAEGGIILEDDCVPDPSFFAFCEELLHHYKDDQRIFGISGNNFTQNRPLDASYYFFLKTTHIWGWASWRRSWRLVDLYASEWPRTKAPPCRGRKSTISGDV